MLGNTTYLPGASVLITDIGQQPPSNRSEPGSTLVCVTSNVNTACCRTSDNNENNTHGGAMGDYYYPNKSIVVRGNAIGNATNTFSRYGYTQQVRLGSIGNPVGPFGNYSCIVPDEHTGNTTIAFIYIYSGNLINVILL